MAIVYTKKDQGRTITAGNGVPVHSANNGDRYTDLDTGDFYLYQSAWIIVGGSTAWGDITGTLSAQTDLISALEAKSDKLISINAQNGGSYTLVLSDAGKLVTMNNGSGNTLVIPLNSSVAFPIGTQILVKQKGAGQTIFLPVGGVLIQSYLNRTQSLGQYSLFTLIKTDVNTWSLGGNLT